MSEHHDLPASSAPPTAPAPVPHEQPQVKHETLPAATTPPSSVTATAAAATAAVGATPMNGNASSGETLVCEWGDCKQQLPSAEALYEHICERHVGRKSTNNLNLTCQWGDCKTTTVKRDHITSHIRVHVPLKPHKCPTCGKAFKRPQDLKKHVKTHADDSVLIQSPEPAARNPDMMYGGPPRPQYNAYPPAHYFETLNAVPSQSYAPSGQYFQPPPPPPQTHSSYGNVYYALNHGHEANHGSYESKKRGYDALNEFFGDLKRRQFDPSSYAAVGQRLMGIQGLQLPMLTGGAEYQTMPAPVAVGGGGGGGGYSSAGPQPAPTYHLPPMSNARTKDDLVTLDHVLEQMQNTIYESDENLQASGVGQPGAHFVHGNNMHYRPSPPTQLPRSHVAATTAAPAVSNLTTTQTPSTGTPALTPPSSAQSYTSGRSPASLPGAQHVSPPHNEGSTSMYPRLPAATVPDGMTAGYPTASSTAPPSTLGGVFDQDDRRRYTGGTLQRARPQERENSAEMDISQSGNEDGERTPTGKEQASKSETEARIASSLIDPALSNDAQDVQRTAQAATEVAERADTRWVEKARLIESLRGWVSSRLERGEFDGQTGAPFGYSEAMDGVESGRAESGDEEAKEPSDTVMYPTLHGAEDEEGDAQMK